MRRRIKKNDVSRSLKRDTGTECVSTSGKYDRGWVMKKCFVRTGKYNQSKCRRTYPMTHMRQKIAKYLLGIAWARSFVFVFFWKSFGDCSPLKSAIIFPKEWLSSAAGEATKTGHTTNQKRTKVSHLDHGEKKITGVAFIGCAHFTAKIAGRYQAILRCFQARLD